MRDKASRRTIDCNRAADRVGPDGKTFWPPPVESCHSSVESQLPARRLPPTMIRISRLASIVVALIAVGLATDYVHVSRKERQLSKAVSNCGGRIGSLRSWPVGSEYRITLSKLPDDGQIKELDIANRMRGWVGIAFPEGKVDSRDLQKLRSKFPNCRILVFRDRASTPMAHTPESPDEQSLQPEPQAGRLVD